MQNIPSCGSDGDDERDFHRLGASYFGQYLGQYPGPNTAPNTGRGEFSAG
jgi:hypothetical protein